MKVFSALVGSLLLCACAVPHQITSEGSLYERVEASLAGRTDLGRLGQPTPQLDQLRWMVGSWAVEAVVFATSGTSARTDHGKARISLVNADTWIQIADSYPEGTQDLGFLTYNLVTRRWVSVGLDSFGNSVVTTGPEWADNRLVLTGSVEIVGVHATIRQTLTKLSSDGFSLLNEEKLPKGQWIRLDEYRYRRVSIR